VLVVAGGDPEEVLQLGEEALDQLRSRYIRLLKQAFRFRLLFGGILGVAPWS
jgi:hypothetical protein